MREDKLFEETLDDLRSLESLTERKIQATIGRQSALLVQLLQEQIDPMARLQQSMLELNSLSTEQKAELRTHIERWNQREKFLDELLQKNIGYIDYVKHLLGLAPGEHRGIDIPL